MSALIPPNPLIHTKGCEAKEECSLTDTVFVSFIAVEFPRDPVYSTTLMLVIHWLFLEVTSFSIGSDWPKPSLRYGTKNSLDPEQHQSVKRKQITKNQILTL